VQLDGGIAPPECVPLTLFDPIWVYDALRHPVYLVATEELFRSRLLGGRVGVYPEGVRTWDGTNAPLIPTIARLIRRLCVLIYTCRCAWFSTA
jgi:hypothetical protein